MIILAIYYTLVDIVSGDEPEMSGIIHCGGARSCSRAGVPTPAVILSGEGVGHEVSIPAVIVGYGGAACTGAMQALYTNERWAECKLGGVQALLGVWGNLN
ncbi:hypothetical protein EG329_006654 [Mollisiaceae sp. DMI_Dod_QoI]|nr:hypothetical protein EG329_006654 [Helotiales sp. DMI_Dod_QoI]